MVALAALVLQLFFLLRIVAMLWLDPQSTTFERSQAWRLYAVNSAPLAGKANTGTQWQQQWVADPAIAESLKRAVIASEDSEFAYHDGVDWDAIGNAWDANAKAEQRMVQQSKVQGPRAGQSGRRGPKIVGGSTITQQLAKNLLLSGERTLLRKAQELVLTFMLERVLDKARILEIYLNHVEWGSGVFGAQAAAHHYYRKNASQLTAPEAARLAVMLPRPKYFEKLPNSDYLAKRAAVIAARMTQVELP